MKQEISFNLIAIFLFLLLLSPAKAYAQSTQLEPASEIKVLEKFFYVEIAEKNGSIFRERTNKVPNLPNKACFGWVITFDPQPSMAKVTEIFTLPAPPAKWSGVEDNPYTQTTTSNNRRTATTNTFKALSSGTMENSWCVEEGDANGDHQIIVLHGDHVLAEFEFELHKQP